MNESKKLSVGVFTVRHDEEEVRSVPTATTSTSPAVTPLSAPEHVELVLVPLHSVRDCTITAVVFAVMVSTLVPAIAAFATSPG